jgi:anti-anti-sigma regulatory factor
MGKKPEDFMGLSEVDLLTPEVAAALLEEEARVIASGRPLAREEEMIDPQGVRRWMHSIKFPLYDADGTLLGIGAFVTDTTERKLLDLETVELKEQVIAAQQAALRERSTPLVPIADGVLAMPLVGTVDNVRASEILETLLQGISERSAHTAILDITGVRAVDAQTANALVGAARAARLLGARVVLTGARLLFSFSESRLESCDDRVHLVDMPYRQLQIAQGIFHAVGAERAILRLEDAHRGDDPAHERRRREDGGAHVGHGGRGGLHQLAPLKRRGRAPGGHHEQPRRREVGDMGGDERDIAFPLRVRRRLAPVHGDDEATDPIVGYLHAVAPCTPRDGLKASSARVYSPSPTSTTISQR